MTLNYIALYGYIGLMFLAALLGITKIFDVGTGFAIVCYIVQLVAYGYVGGVMTLNVAKPFLEAKGRAD